MARQPDGAGDRLSPTPCPLFLTGCVPPVARTGADRGHDMHDRRTAAAMAAALLGTALPAAATTTLLDFDAGEACATSCSNGSQIRPAYGNTAEVRTTLLARAGFGDTPIATPAMFWWNTGFGDLQGVAWVSGTAEYRFELLAPGKLITLDSFDMARFTGTTPTELRVYDLGWNLLWSATDQLAPTGGRLSYAPGVSSATGLILQHGPEAANRGLDNIRFTLSDALTPSPAIPEPASWALMIAGLGLAGAALRRRRRVPAA